MRLAVSSEEIPIVYEPKFREYGIRVLDGGTSNIELLYCPWSGHKLLQACEISGLTNLSARELIP